MNEIILTLQLDEVNRILEALGSQPYITVFSLVSKIQSQAKEQIDNANASTSNGDANIA